MHDERALIEGRLARILQERIKPAIYPCSERLTAEVWDVSGEPVPVAQALAATYRPCERGEPWGTPWATRWFRLSGQVPDEWAGRCVEAVVDLGFAREQPGFSAEALVYRLDGTVVKGLNPLNTWVPIDTIADGGAVTLFVEAAANPEILSGAGMLPTGLGDPATAGSTPQYTFVDAALAVRDDEVWQLVQDLEVLGQLMHELSLDDSRRWEILTAVERCLDTVDLQAVGASSSAARRKLVGVLSRPAHASAHRISAVGHAHIDSAWLWPKRETVRKVARTASNVVALMDDHPDFVFAMSQAQQLAWIRQYHPEVYSKVKEKIACGQFVPVGGMWVESDTNMPGSEALARQFVHGKRFFAEEFDIETEEVWLPDSFGYSAALPQLIRLSGSRWFLTQKMSWNNTNTFPHHTFWWEGIDGTRVFTHFPPVDTYNSELSGAELAHAARNFSEKGKATRSLVPFGWGDGGGGPTREMLARAARITDLEGSPTVALESPKEFFTAAEAEYPDAPVWVGELYLELHRGTYTSQARTKRGNRRSEHLLREAELWAATATVRTGCNYPYETLDRIWKTVLLNQFHDILPGSSIAWVHREAEAAYEHVGAELRNVIEAATTALAGTGDSTVVFNAAPHTLDAVPALGAVVHASVLTERSPEQVTVATEDDAIVLDNGLLRVRLDDRGLVTSLRDLVADRELIPSGRVGNLLQIHPDLPNAWDAWDVDSFYRNRVANLMTADSVSVGRQVSNLVEVAVSRQFFSSTVVQSISLRAGQRRLDVRTDIDWHERETILKVAWPLDLQSDRFAAETQFGHVYRPSHTNTTWDAARFEVCAHRFVHVDEAGYGVAVVNDSTYGHDVTRDGKTAGPGTTTTVRLSLLRAPRFPDPEADQGLHTMRCAIVPGASMTDAVREGYRINLPPRTVAGSSSVHPLVAVDHDGIVIECVKLADDRSGDVVVRLYEALGRRQATRLRPGFRVENTFTCDLLERPVDALDMDPDQVLSFSLRPFEIMTVRMRRTDCPAH